MKKMFVFLMAMILLNTTVLAEENSNAPTDRSEEDVASIINESIQSAQGELTLTFDANITTGYTWSGFVLGGDSVSIDEAASGYVSDPNPDLLDGVGGVHHFVLKAEKAGESVLCFTYSRSFDDISEERLFLMYVDEEMMIYAMDVTDKGSAEGIVTAVNAEENSVTLLTESLGEVTLFFPEDMALPVLDEQIRVYTNGTLTMSLPPIMNVIAWESIPQEQAR